MAAIQALAGTLPEAPAVTEAFALSLGGTGTVLGHVQGELVAVAALGAPSPAVWAALRGGFDLGGALPGGEAGPEHEGAALLQSLVVDPVFEPHTAAFLTAALGLARRRALLLAAPAAAPPPPAAAACMLRVAPRRRLPRDAAACGDPCGSGGALLAFTTWLALKEPVHARVVIVGASDTGLACAEALLTGARHRGAAFTHLTLLAPGGLARGGGGGEGAHFSEQRLRMLGLAGGVCVVDGAMAGVDRRDKVVVLEGGGALPYDLLVIAAGLEVGGVCFGGRARDHACGVDLGAGGAPGRRRNPRPCCAGRAAGAHRGCEPWRVAPSRDAQAAGARPQPRPGRRRADCGRRPGRV